MEGHVRVMKLLLEKGANLHARDIKDRTAIYMAAEENCQDVLRVNHFVKLMLVFIIIINIQLFFYLHTYIQRCGWHMQ